MFQVVAVSLNPALLSYLRKYCELGDSRWQLKVFPTIGSVATAPRDADDIDLFFFDAQGMTSSLEEKRLACFMAPLALRVVVTNPEHDDVVLAHLDHFHSFSGASIDFDHLIQLFRNAERVKQLPQTALSKRLLSSFLHYPVFPKLSEQLQRKLKDPKVEISQIARLLEQDPVVVSRLMQLVNSPYMGFVSETLSLDIAVSRLGLQVVNALVLMLSLKSLPQALEAAAHNKVLDNAMQFANQCRELAKEAKLRRIQQDQVFISAIFSCFGQLLLLQNGFELNDPQLKNNDAGAVRTDVAVAVHLLCLWGFDDRIINPLLAQHQFMASDDEAADISNCLYLARLSRAEQTALPADVRDSIAASVFASAIGIKA